MNTRPISDFVDRMIPSSLRDTEGLSFKDSTRIRALAMMMVATTVAAVVSLSIVVVVHLVSQPEALKNDLISAALVFLFCIQTFCFYKFGNYRVSAIFFSLSFFLSILGLVLVSGGYLSAMMPFLLLCPMVSFLIGGKQEGFQMFSITLLVGLGLCFADYMGIKAGNIFEGGNPHVAAAINWVFILVIIVSCLMIYEAALDRAEDNN
jgi:hypothetical protein